MNADGPTTEPGSTDEPPTGGGTTDGPTTTTGGDDTAGTGALNALTLFGSHLAVGVLSAAAGVMIGGWIAFETGYWDSFKTWIEGLGGDAVALAAGLLLLALVVSLAAGVRSFRR